jgi:hypothetical protein
MKQTTEANEPIEVDDDVSHEASENKEQGKFQSCWANDDGPLGRGMGARHPENNFQQFKQF